MAQIISLLIYENTNVYNVPGSNKKRERMEKMHLHTYISMIDD